MNPATIELTAPDISCEKCKANIEGDLAGDPGTAQVTVDVATRRVRITYDPEHTSTERLRARLSEIGYPAAPHPVPAGSIVIFGPRTVQDEQRI